MRELSGDQRTICRRKNFQQIEELIENLITICRSNNYLQIEKMFYLQIKDTAQKLRFSIKDFFSKCDQIHLYNIPLIFVLKCVTKRRKPYTIVTHHKQIVSNFSLAWSSLRLTQLFKCQAQYNIFLPNPSIIQTFSTPH